MNNNDFHYVLLYNVTEIKKRKLGQVLSFCVQLCKCFRKLMVELW